MCLLNELIKFCAIYQLILSNHNRGDSCRLGLGRHLPRFRKPFPPRLNWIYPSTRMSGVIGTVIDDADTSALGFQYYGIWTTGNRLQQHYASTSTYSDAPYSRAVLFFRGKRPLCMSFVLSPHLAPGIGRSVTYYADQGNFSQAAVSIDGQAEDFVNLTSSTPMYKQPVWSKNLTEGDHQLVIRHAGPPNTNIMIDYVSCVDLCNHVRPMSNDLQRQLPFWRWGGIYICRTVSGLTGESKSANNRSTVQLQDGMFYARRSLLTQSSGASAQFTFNGTAIWYFTDTNSDHAQLRIRIDDDEEGQIVRGYSLNPLVQRLVWSKTDLPPGTHTINITHDDSDGKYATLDFFRYVESAGTEPYAKTGGLTVGAIVGIVIAGLFLLGILYCIAIRWAVPRSRTDRDSDAPPSYHAANSNSQSSISSSQRPDFITTPHMTHLGDPRIVPSPAPFTTRQATPEPAELVLDTPAQRYRDSARLLLAGNRASHGSSIGASSTPDLHAKIPSNPPSYQVILLWICHMRITVPVFSVQFVDELSAGYLRRSIPF
ncbi:hypothetical protein AG1IA_05373 [Rhizoctonia solani AG-1 IA]|uniref:Transmembrane protein n=1 Tax=Thanatephorus cucumeris (strain AG1-IA) TaxID=983506 RepID=L8WUX1_THACA|nr:hypothetical protein AG1IA_05373 [Rhizoctonia solani AG-1 IA]